ncbi:hypothetical protein KY41_05715 [Latilactobacillus sakei]|uniref:hypothetical protein n=1 Tax=Latilactobacillus sakei TaxID=1599 RepID=UPI00050887F0|nr:hypothetical protein KY41_05715 [Latilactobacillus sakei]
MEIKQSAVVGFSHELVKRYQRFFELDDTQELIEQPQMQPSQIQLYMMQAFDRHYRLAIQFNVAEHIEQVNGRLIKQLDEQTYLLKENHSNLYKIVTLNQIRYISKITNNRR